MPSRIDRVNELIKASIAEIISREIEMPSGVFATVTKVDTTRDLRYTRVFVSVFPEKQFGRTMDLLRKKIYQVQGRLNKKLHMKPLPRVEFIVDKTEVKANKIEKLMKEI